MKNNSYSLVTNSTKIILEVWVVGSNPSRGPFYKGKTMNTNDTDTGESIDIVFTPEIEDVVG